MPKFESGVSFYTKGQATVSVNFPEDDIKCQYCEFCRSETDLKRWWCRLTGEMIYFPFMGIGDKCPIIFENKEE